MGMFLALSGVMDAPQVDVQNVLLDFAQSRSGGLELIQESTDGPNIGVISRTGKNTTIIYPNGFCEWDDASKHISACLSKTVFSLHIHDGDLWMFVLFNNGNEIGRFNPVPEYWEELDPEVKATWKGDAELISGVIPNISPNAIAKYFVEWDLEQEEELKAYPDDEFAIGDCWQICDFMKKLGLEYPMGPDGDILGDTFQLWTKEFRRRRVSNKKPIEPPSITATTITAPAPASPTPPCKPWWKLW